MDLLDKHHHQGSSFCVIFPFIFVSLNWYSDGFVCMRIHWVNINIFWSPLVLALWLTSLVDINLARRWLSTYLVWPYWKQYLAHGKNIQCQPCEFLNLLISPLYGKHLSLRSFMAANLVSYYSILAYSCATFEHFFT